MAFVGLGWQCKQAITAVVDILGLSRAVRLDMIEGVPINAT
jgi:hypothetical protein